MGEGVVSVLPLDPFLIDRQCIPSRIVLLFRCAKKMLLVVDLLQLRIALRFQCTKTFHLTLLAEDRRQGRSSLSHL
jgi:hypothetical protein